MLSSMYLNNIDSVTDGAQGALTGIPGFTVNNMLFADDLSLPSNEHADLQTMNKLRLYAEKKSLTVNTQKSEVMCFNSSLTPAPPGL